MDKHFETMTLGAMDRYREEEGLVMFIDILYIKKDKSLRLTLLAMRRI